MRFLVSLNLVILALLGTLFLYEHYEGMTNLARWKDAVLTQCEQQQKVIGERRYKSGHVVKDLR